MVRSAKDKHYEELNNTIKLIRNHKKIKDVAKLLSGFEDLIKAYQKAKSSVIDKEEGGKIPKFYIKCLVELDDFVNENWEDRKNMNKNNSKSLTTLRQKLRKYNKDFEQEINDYRENPDSDEGEKESSEESDSDEEGIDTGTKAPAENFVRAKTSSITSKDMSDEDDDDDIDWDMSASSEESTSDDDDSGENLLSKFLKKDVDKDKEVKKREKKVKEIKKKKEEEGEWTKVEGTVPTEKPKMFAKDAEINHQILAKKLHEVLAMRGKKRIDNVDQIEMLHELLAISRQNNFGPALEAKILIGLQSSLADYRLKKSNLWKDYLQNMDTLIEILEKNDDLTVKDNIPEDQESFQNPPYKVQGCILTLMEKMDEEFVKMLQTCDSHSPDYVEKLRDESRIISIISKVRSYLEKNDRGSPSDLCRIYMLTIDFIYYKFDPKIISDENQLVKKVQKLIINSNEKTDDDINGDYSNLNSMQLIDRLCKYIYVHDDNGLTCKMAALCQVYHFALHDKWYEARDLMIMTGLQNSILNYKSDIQLQILYNRALVQLGLCAFRHGFIFEAHSSLLDILFKGRVRELLGQGLNCF